MKQFILGLIMVGAGISMAIKTDGWINTFGRMRWAEEHLSGGTRQGYKVLAVFVILFGLLAMTGEFFGFAGGILTKIFVK